MTNDTVPKRPQPPHVYVGLNQIMGDLKPIVKRDINVPGQRGYQAFGVDDLFEALHDLFVQHRILLLPYVEDVTFREGETQKGGRAVDCHLIMRYDFVSAVDGSSHSVRFAGEARDTQDKSANKAAQQAIKYLLVESLLIVTGERDADHPVEELQSSRKPVHDLDTDDLIEQLAALHEREERDPDHDLEICPACFVLSGGVDHIDLWQNDNAPYWKCRRKPGECLGTTVSKGREWSWAGWSTDWWHSVQDWWNKQTVTVDSAGDAFDDDENWRGYPSSPH